MMVQNNISVYLARILPTSALLLVGVVGFSTTFGSERKRYDYLTTKKRINLPAGVVGGETAVVEGLRGSSF